MLDNHCQNEEWDETTTYWPFWRETENLFVDHGHEALILLYSVYDFLTVQLTKEGKVIIYQKLNEVMFYIEYWNFLVYGFT